jgi:hypothetical protein
MLRRVVAMLTVLFTANLTMVGSDFACAEHPGDAAGMHKAMAHREHAAPDVSHAQDDEAACSTPSVPMCCQALTSCAVALSPAASQSMPLSARLAGAVLESVSEAPPSEIIAPDPPPPRT